MLKLQFVYVRERIKNKYILYVFDKKKKNLNISNSQSLFIPRLGDIARLHLLSIVSFIAFLLFLDAMKI